MKIYYSPDAPATAAALAKPAALSPDELIIREKMTKGLSRAQAVAAIQRQREHDAQKSPRRPATK
jgi:hypothetical protein